MKFIQNYSKEYKVELTKALLKDIENDLLGQEVPEIAIKRVSESIADAKAYLANSDSGELDGIASGFESIDKSLRGFVPDELSILTGVSGHGKSTFLMAMLVNMALNNTPVLYVTLEQSSTHVTARMLQQLKSKTTEDLLGDLPIYFYDDEIANIDVLEQVIKESVAQGIKLIAIDHVGFFSRRDTETESEISIKLKLFARRYKVAIIAVAHLRKMNQIDKLPTMDDIKGSSSIYQDSDNFIVLWQDMAGSKIQKNDMLLLIRKNRRHGDKDTIHFRMDKNLNPVEIKRYYEEIY